MKIESASSVIAKPTRAPGGFRELHSWSESAPRSTIDFGAAAFYISRNVPDLQARAFAAASPGTTSSAVGVVRAPKRPAMSPRRLVLRGDPAMLRRLRAAEMVAWEASGPKALPESKTSASRLPPRSLLVSKLEALLFLTLSAAAAAGVMIGLVDLHALVVNWTRFASWIDSLM